MRSSGIAVLALSIFGLLGCGGEQGRRHIAQVTAGGDPHRGADKIQYYGCGSCHIIPGISGATGRAGPPLSGIGNRIYIAGVLQNTPGNMMRWIQNPKAVDQKTVMPNLNVSPRDAADIAGYLYTLQ